MYSIFLDPEFANETTIEEIYEEILQFEEDLNNPELIVNVDNLKL